MRLMGKALLFVFFVSVLITAVLGVAYTSAAQYMGDGATPDGAGGWAEPPASTGPSDPNYNWWCGAMCHAITSAQFRRDLKCLECHGTGPIYTPPSSSTIEPQGINTDYICKTRHSTSYCDKSGYLMTGHKNVLRKVVAGSPWTDAAGNFYAASDPYGSGSVLYWSAGTVLAGGTEPPKTLFYIFGGWMSPDTLNTIYDGGFTGELSASGNYQCARCHTTGYRFDASGPLPSQTDIQFRRVPASGVSLTSSWYADGIQCERCHRDAANDAGGHVCYDPGGNHVAAYDGNWYACVRGGLGGSMKVAVPTYESATALCLECHRQESVDAGSNIVLSTSLNASSTGPSYMPFLGNGIGQEFLNSPHARFTGGLSQKAQNSPELTIYVTGSYNSHFQNLNAGADYGKNSGCTACHDVHQSTVEAVNAAAPFKTQCPDCHSEGGNLSRIKHPSGSGTPLGDMTDTAGACRTCHMPSRYHLFRINVDAGYSTFPSEAQFNGGQTGANTASDGTLTEAVWIDLDLACGRCHGGSLGSGAVHNNAPYLTKAELALYASDMHNMAPKLAFGYTTDGLTVNVDAAGSSGTASYAWNWGDGSAIQTVTSTTTSHTYPSAGTYTVTLSSQKVSVAKKITVYAPDLPPSVGITGFTNTTAGVSFTDSSNDDHGVVSVTVNWGDGSMVSTGAAGGLFSHAYPVSGDFTITHKAFDSAGQSAFETFRVTVSAAVTTYSIAGIVTKNDGTTAISGATLTFKNISTGSTKTTYSNSVGAFSVIALKAGTYSVTAVRSGFTFPAIPNQIITTSNITGLTVKSVQ